LAFISAVAPAKLSTASAMDFKPPTKNLIGIGTELGR
jgi:hypothetical protein